jgi:hypothetical protein
MRYDIFFGSCLLLVLAFVLAPAHAVEETVIEIGETTAGPTAPDTTPPAVEPAGPLDEGPETTPPTPAAQRRGKK